MAGQEAPKRPLRSSIEVRRLAVREIAADVARWAEGEVTDDFIESLAQEADNDAYLFAKNLDRSGWDADYDLVEILATYSDWKAWDDLSAQWVTTTGFVVPFRVSDMVTDGRREFKVVVVDQKHGRVTARPTDGEKSRFGGDWGETGGYIFDAERLSPVPANAEA